MTLIRIIGHTLDIDIRAELEQFEWTRPTWTDEKLVAASPFRYDRTPSFYVYLRDTPSAPAGSWGDSGAYDSDYAKGGIVKLLSFLRNETEEETIDYLIETYSNDYSDDTLPKLAVPKLTTSKRLQPLDESILDDYNRGHPYLTRRGISEKVQRKMGVGYDHSSRAITIPWRFPNGRLANVKYRKIYGKAFWYRKDAIPIRRLVYGINLIYNHAAKEAVLCEAEIDAMSWWVAGVPAVATGGVSFTNEQRDIIIRSPIEQLYVATDNDKAGKKLRRQVPKELNGYINVYDVYIPREYKDANDVLIDKGCDYLRGLVSSYSIRTTSSIGTFK